MQEIDDDLCREILTLIQIDQEKPKVKHIYN